MAYPGALEVEAGVLVTDAGPETHTPGWPAGLWLVGVDGDVRPLVSREWQPLAVGASGRVVAVARGAIDSLPTPYTYVVVGKDGSISLPHESAGLPCAAWSSRGELLYLTGTTRIYHEFDSDQPSAVGVEGTLWSMEPGSSRNPRRVARGLFAGCLAWSPTADAAAFIVRAADSPPRWSVDVYRDGQIETIATLNTPVPSLAGRPYAWSPSEDRLLFLDGDTARLYEDGRTREFSKSQTVRRIGEASDQNSDIEADAFDRRLAFSPDGRFVVVAVGAAAGVMGTSGQLSRVAIGRLRGWAGDNGILMVSDVAASGEAVIPSLVLFPVDATLAEQTLVKGFKQVIVTDPDGRWFAYASPRATGMNILFRTAQGAMLANFELQFRPTPLAAVGTSGHINEPAWP